MRGSRIRILIYSHTKLVEVIVMQNTTLKTEHSAKTVNRRPSEDSRPSTEDSFLPAGALNLLVGFSVFSRQSGVCCFYFFNPLVYDKKMVWRPLRSARSEKKRKKPKKPSAGSKALLSSKTRERILRASLAKLRKAARRAGTSEREGIERSIEEAEQELRRLTGYTDI